MNNIVAIQQLPDAIRIPVLHAFTSALDDLFLIAIPLVGVALLVSFFLKEVPLRTGRRAPVDAAVADTGPAEALSAGLSSERLAATQARGVSALPVVLDLGYLRARDLPGFGGKAANLGELIAMGMPRSAGVRHFHGCL